MYLGKNFSGVVETLEKRAVTPLLGEREQLVPSRDGSRMLGESVGTEYFAAYRPDQPPVRIAIPAKETQKPVGGFFWRDYSCHWDKLPLSCCLQLQRQQEAVKY